MWELVDLVDSCYGQHQMADALTVFALKLGVYTLLTHNEGTVLLLRA